jgi:hypothetical protein
MGCGFGGLLYLVFDRDVQLSIQIPHLYAPVIGDHHDALAICAEHQQIRAEIHPRRRGLRSEGAQRDALHRP